MKKEHFISVDIEAAGPVPGEFSMLSLGACSLNDIDGGLLLEFKPINRNANPDALKITGNTLDDLARRGLEPEQGMNAFRTWIEETIDQDETPVFVGFNAPFDWSFVNYYFHRYSRGNPFGFAGLDIKSFYMGKFGSTWSETKSSKIASALNISEAGDHNPLHDAQYQARLFLAMLQR